MVVPAFPNHRRLICAAPSPPERKGDTPQGQGEIAVDGHHPTGVRERRVVLATAVELLARKEQLDGGERARAERAEPHARDGTRPAQLAPDVHPEAIPEGGPASHGVTAGGRG